ncbi:LpxI family protein [Aureimonas leprariae]|uniref:DUF1009 domain-containing protein n=1 Tax=Plantimonas leprariae TaxID=2615207 RepID=A0A7V7TY00_9HYPH|nr:UDP-2,3-diacylglucosamine diphosphatase LpxI [Aureimonas leprariae]KAB0681786.1 DUF1009 domain-containing protein [Aureimonas leprariae]
MTPAAGIAPDRPGEPIGIAAGGGILPRIVVDAALRGGWTPHVLSIADGIDAEWSGHPARRMAWGQLGDGLRWLGAAGVRKLVLCGTVSVRPDFRSILPTLHTLLMLRQIFAVIRGGDDNLLRAATKTFEARGFQVVAVQAIAPELVAAEGTIAGPPLQKDDEAAISRGFAAARALGQLDIGQAAVASRDRVIALEGIEGTREMLARVADLRARGRVGRHERCVLVKCRKPAQDDRFDLPSIGASTLDEAAGAGLVGIALSAGHSLLLGIDDIARGARAKGIFVVGRRDDRP